MVLQKVLPLLFGLILSCASWGQALLHFSPISEAQLQRRSIRLNERNKAIPMHLRNNSPPLIHDGDQRLDGVSTKSNDRFVVARRTWCQKALIAISTATGTVGVGGQIVTAIEAPSEVVDPLVLFGESLSSKSSNNLNSVLPASSSSTSSSSSSSSWPHNAAHPLPTLADPLLPTPIAETESRAPALEQVLEQSKLKKQINPTTHG